MPIRMTGMNSGLQTDMIIQELVKGQKAKVDNAKKVHTAFQWKQDAWKDLNTKALKLHKMIDSLRWPDAYVKKTSKVSNTAKASVVTGETAVKGVQELEINKLAKTAYLTGAKITKTDGKAVNAETKLSDIMDIPPSGEMSFTVKSGNKEQQIQLTGDTKIKDVVNHLKAVGLNASFDANNGRFFISSQKMGTAGDFSIVADNENGFTALNKLGINVYEQSDYEALSEVVKFKSDGVTFTEEYQALYDTEKAKNLKIDKDARDAANTALTKHQDLISGNIDAFKSWLTDNDSGYVLTGLPDPDLEVMERMEAVIGGMNATITTKNSAISALEAEIADDIENGLDVTAKEEQLLTLKGERDGIANQIEDSNYAKFTKADYLSAKDHETTLSTAATAAQAEVDDVAKRDTESQAKVDADIAFAVNAMSMTGNQIGADGASRIKGEDAEILLNGATFTSSNNTFNINGLTINAIQETKGEKILITTEDDTEGIYDTIKNFIKEYSALINEMDRLYNAESARDYKPLTEEEKEAMSEKEVEEWEKKIKDSVLRRDSSLFDISNVMKTSMMKGVNVNGKDMHLSDFGIEALSYFLAGKNEKNAYHILGDPDNVYSSGTDGTNKLKEWIAKDAKTVTDFFTGLSKNLFAEMDKIIMKSDNFKSFNSLYNDKQYKADLTKYNNEIAKQEAKLLKMEDRYYKQYSAMEVAMAKMQSNQSALSGLLGM